MLSETKHLHATCEALRSAQGDSSSDVKCSKTRSKRNKCYVTFSFYEEANGSLLNDLYIAKRSSQDELDEEARLSR